MNLMNLEVFHLIFFSRFVHRMWFLRFIPRANGYEDEKEMYSKRTHRDTTHSPVTPIDFRCDF